MSKKDHDLLGLLRTRVERPTGGGGSARESGRRSQRGTVRATSFPAPPPASDPGVPAEPTTPLLQRVTRQLQRLQEHVVLTKGFLAACGALLLFLCFAVYLVGYRRGENRGRESALAQVDTGDEAARRLQNSPLDVRVPKTMQDPGIGQLLRDPEGRRQDSAKEPAPQAGQGTAQAGPPPAAPAKARHGLQLITYADTANGRGRAADMLRHLKDQGIADVKLVQEGKDGMLSVLVLVADGSKETVKAARSRVRALPPPSFDKSYEFAKQELVLVTY